jgi:Fur family transcriptional regulator, peroxide stress response regulator
MQDGRESFNCFREVCRSMGVPATHQRHVIYNCLKSSNDHPTPEQIYHRVRELIPAISVATVYKCLRSFMDAGLVAAASLHHGPLRVESNMTPHHHLVCRICGSMADLDASAFASPRLLVKPPPGFRIETTTVEVIGACTRCLETKSRGGRDEGTHKPVAASERLAKSRPMEPSAS